MDQVEHPELVDHQVQVEHLGLRVVQEHQAQVDLQDRLARVVVLGHQVLQGLQVHLVHRELVEFQVINIKRHPLHV